MSQLEIQKVDIDNHTFRVILLNDVKMYFAIDLYKILGYRQNDAHRIRSSPQNKEIVKIENSKMTVLNFEGVREFLLSSRKKINVKLNEYFNVDVNNSSLLCKESQIGTALSKAFKETNIISQYKVSCAANMFYIDFYLPDYKIAVEIDENGHKDYEKCTEIHRQKYIEKQLGCIFIRFNPDNKKTDIFDLIYEIRMLMK